MLREIRYWAVQCEFRLRAVHVPGVKNSKADTLSRSCKDNNHKNVADLLIQTQNWQEKVDLEENLNEFW